tara:strand:- start:1111 stop:2499 length:1389 start_codon:yes stop_codon:yes gene_type:complete
MTLKPAPIAYYPLGGNASTGGDATNTLSVPNVAVPDASVFDFADDNIKVDNIGSLFSGITNFSFSGWFNLTSFSGQQVFNILEGNSSKFGINTFNNQLRFNVYSGVAYIANLQNITSTNTWFHYAGVFDGSGASDTDRLKLYINGQPQTVTYNTTTPTSFPTLLSTARIFIGGSVSPFNGMTGKASNIQLWTSSLIPSQIQTLYNNGQPLMTGTQPQEANLKAWYKLDQTANWEADTAGNWQIPDNRSAYPQSFNFNGSSDYINISDFSSIVTNGDITLSMWFKTSSTSQQYLIATSQTFGTSCSLFMPSNGSGQLWFRRGNNTSGGEVTCKTSSGYNDGKWHNVICTSDSSMKIYVDGELDIQATTSTPTVSDSQFLTIGVNGSSGTYFFNGKISNVAIWHSNQESEKDNIYNNGVPATSYTNSPVAWYKLDNTSIWYENTGQWGIPNAASTNNQVINFSN